MQIIDVRNSEGQLAIIGGSLVLPTSDNVSDSTLNGSIRWNVTSETIEFYTNGQWQAVNLGALSYQGIWNAATNVPTIVSGVGNKGYYYKVSVSGNTTIDGISEWLANDSIVFDGTHWDKISGNDSSALSALSDVTISNPTNGQILAYSGATWQNVSAPYDIYGTYLGTPSDAQILWRIVIARAVTFPVNLAGSVAISEGAPAGNTYLTILKNGVPIGSINYASNSTQATFTFASQVVFDSGDILEIDGANPADSVFYSPSWAFVCTR